MSDELTRQRPHPERYPSVRCTAVSSRTGKPCRRWASHGANVCTSHGARAPQVREKARQNVAEWKATRILGRMGCAVDVHPLDALLEMVCQAAGCVAYLQGQIHVMDRLTETNMLTGTGESHVMVKMYAEWCDRLARFSKLALDAGVDERQVRIAEAQGQQLAAVVRAAVAAAAVGGEQAGLKAAAEEMRRLRSG